MKRIALLLSLAASTVFAQYPPVQYEEATGYLVYGTGAGTVATNTNPNSIISENTFEPTGFVEHDNVDVLYDYTARTITLTNSGNDIEIYWRGTNVNLGTSWTSSAHDATTNIHYLAMRDSTNITWSTTPWTFDAAQVAIAYYDAGNSVYWAIHETHGCVMDHDTHEELHLNIGAYVNSGLDIVAGSYTLQDGTDNAAVTPSWAEGAVHDEDNHTTIPATVTGHYTRVWFTDTAAVITTNNSYMVQVTGTYPDINTYDGSGFTTNETSNGKYFNLWVGVAPMAQDAVSQEYRVFVVQPQTDHDTLASAETESTLNLNMAQFASIGPEYVFRYKITGRCSASYSTTGKWRIEEVTKILGSAASQVNVSGAVAVNTAAAITTDTSAFDGILSATDTTVQTALDTIDDTPFALTNAYNTFATSNIFEGDIWMGIDGYFDLPVFGLGGIYLKDADGDNVLYWTQGTRKLYKGDGTESVDFNGLTLTGAWSVDGSLAVTGAVSAANLYPQRATMWHDEATVTAGNAITRVANTAAQIYNMQVYQSPAANADAFSHSLFLKAGTYTFYVLGFTANNRGIIDWAVDGVNIVTGQDWYSAASTYNVVKSTASITITGDGYHKLTGTVNGKNAGSGGYYIVITKYWFKPATDAARD